MSLVCKNNRCGWVYQGGVPRYNEDDQCPQCRIGILKKIRKEYQKPFFTISPFDQVAVDITTAVASIFRGGAQMHEGHRTCDNCHREWATFTTPNGYEYMTPDEKRRARISRQHKCPMCGHWNDGQPFYTDYDCSGSEAENENS